MSQKHFFYDPGPRALCKQGGRRNLVSSIRAVTCKKCLKMILANLKKRKPRRKA